MVKRKKGHIMSVASMASFAGLAGMADYACVKVGLVAFHESLTQELKHRYHSPQIKTSIVHPNWTRTRLNAPMHDKLTKRFSKIMEPTDVAKAMVQQIIKVKSGQLILGGPGQAGALRGFPIWLQEIFRDMEAGMVTMNATSDVAEAAAEGA
jgi:short-subunit dehydrogenase